MKQGYFLLIILGILLTACTKESTTPTTPDSPSAHSLLTELKALYDVGLLASYDAAESWQVSSFDTTGGNDDGFGGKYSYLRRNADSSLVIFDVQEPGVINRIWTPTPTDDILDFFLDGSSAPTFSIKYSDLFSGKQFPFVAPLCGNQIGGYFCYVPIPFAKGCKIVCRGKKLQFHQIQYRLFPKTDTVETFKPDLSPKEKVALANIALLWVNDKALHDFMDDGSAAVQKTFQSFDLSPGQSTTIFQATEGGRIRRFELSPASAFEGIYKDIDIKITWDDDKTPAVYCPVADFFGYAFGTPSMQSLLVGSRGDMNYCYFPMPFDGKAKIELIYRDRQPDAKKITITSNVYHETRKRDVAREGKFYTYWNKNINPPKGKPHVFLEREGRGHYVGTVLQAQGLKAGMTYFFEGDDSTSIDGVNRIHGTGSEDYFNGGWYAMLDRWDGRMSLPLHGALDYALPFCRTGGYRLYLSDKVSFKEKIFHSIEHGPTGNAFPVDYTSVAFYYCDSPPVEATEPAAASTQVYLPDTLMLYPQLMQFTTSGSIDFRSAWKYNTGGESFTFTAADNTWLRISLADIPQDAYTMYLDLIRKPDGCDFSAWQRQTPLSDWITTYNPSEERQMYLRVCDVDVRDFKNTVTLRFKSQANRNSFLLNRLILVRKNK